MPDYAHLACYSYSSTLRWSYGTCRNRRWGEWQQHVTRLTPSQMIRALCLAGFDGLYVDRRGFADGAQGLLPELRSLLGTEIVASDSGEQLLFSLTGFARQLRLTMDQTSWVREQSRLLNRPCVLCQNGFLRWAPISPPEPRRATHSATMRLINPGDAPRRVTLTIMWQRHTGREIDVRIVGESLGVERDERPPMDRGPLVIDMDLPPGEHLLNFNATPKPIGLSRMYTAWNATEVRLDTKD
jgi:phosphoglycerol transferase